MQHNKVTNTVIAMFLFIAFAELIRTAWISDDAAITLRTVLNLIHGYGLTFNIDERVQAYTHPLWFLLISALSVLIGNVFTSTFLLSITISLVVIWLLMSRIATSFWAGVLGATVLILSKAYVDYSTSGLENPLSHLLILLGIISGLKAVEESRFNDLVIFFLVCSFLYLNRPDLILLVGPLAILVLYKSRVAPSLLVKAIFIGALPVLIWTSFSIYYYGFPLPNTAYAKLGTGIQFLERSAQGIRYLLDSIGHDPVTLAVTAIGFIIGFRSSLFSLALAVGGGLYLAYVVSIGGDFMSGRFFTVPLLVAVIIFVRSTISKQQLQACVVGFGVLGLMSINSTLLSGSTYTNTTISDNGIADERGFYYQRYGLLTASKSTFAPSAWTTGSKSVSVVCGGLGFAGITSGPSAHLIDSCALADPLLARLPAKNNPNWRIGHFIRQLPTDYQESIEKNANVLNDPATKVFYESIRTVTRGPLADPERLREIVKINLGQVQKPDWDMYKYKVLPRSSKVKKVEIDALQRIMSLGAWNAPGNVQFGVAVEVHLPAKINLTSFDMALDNNDSYNVEYLIDGKYVQLIEVGPTPTNTGGMVQYIRKLDDSTAPTDRIKITALSGDGLYSLGHFKVNTLP
jgi:arabinofuranosyltransferase